jgi:chromosome segregation ATPase
MAKPKKPAAKKPKRASQRKPKAKKPVVDRVALEEELAEARAQLARIASEENSARRDLETQVSIARSVEERLTRELEALRVDLRTALADLEIARADHQRAETKLLDALRTLAEVRESERLATHASADARERLVDLGREIDRLRRQLEQVTVDDAETRKVQK